ncbi:MAG TPA: VC0807 family protein [Acidisoma sp.]|nr:VC0807 family protein [Acidisoma sp.]
MKYLSLNLVLELAANILAPWAVFSLLDPHYGDTTALIGSAVPPLVWSVIELVRSRRLDSVSVVVTVGILLTLVATVLGGSPKLLQIRENAVTGLIGVVFLVTLLLERPLIYHLTLAVFVRQGREEAQRLEGFAATEKGVAFFRHLTLLWGVGLVAQTAVMVWLVYLWPIGRYLLLSPVIGYGILGLLLAGTFWYRRRVATI